MKIIKKANKMIVIFMLLVAIVAGGIVGVVMYNRLKYPICFENFVMQYSAEYSIEPSLVYAVILTESGFMQEAESVVGAVGLMQIMPDTAKFIAGELRYVDFSLEDLKNPQLNIEFGCYYLAYLFNKFDSLEEVLFAYNAGEGNLLKFKKENGVFDEEKISISETKNYIKKVKSAKAKYDKIIRYQLK